MASINKKHSGKISNQGTHIFVSYYVPFQVVKNRAYTPVQAGKSVNNYNPGIKGDDSGDNISAQNYIYSELTILYWVWKNTPKQEFIGFCHYRRFFDFFNKEKFPVALRIFSEDQVEIVNFLPVPEIRKIISGYDIIIPKKIVLPHSLKRNYEKNHFSEHYNLLKEKLQEMFPEYLNSFNHVQEKTNKLPPFNMFVTSWNVFGQYCSFIFPLFEEVKKTIIMPEDKSQHRIFGYMGERLLATFIYHHKLKTKEIPILYFKKTGKKKTKLIFYAGNLFKNLIFWIRQSL